MQALVKLATVWKVVRCYPGDADTAEGALRVIEAPPGCPSGGFRWPRCHAFSSPPGSIRDRST